MFGFGVPQVCILNWFYLDNTCKVKQHTHKHLTTKKNYRTQKLSDLIVQMYQS